MTSLADPPLSTPETSLKLPSWATRSFASVAQDDAFAAGAALAILDLATHDPALPAALWRDRLALKAACACLKREGRRESAAEVRDAVCLTRTGDAPGPAGEMFARWRGLARVKVTGPGAVARLARLLPEGIETRLELDKERGSPIFRAGKVFAETLRAAPRQETAALMRAEAVLAQGLRWEYPVPLLAAHLSRRQLRDIAAGEADPILALHGALRQGAEHALRLAGELTRRAARLRAVAPKLRAKASEAAVSLFLSQDAVAPTGMLSPRVQGTAQAMSDRAARRLCDRLVGLGAVRELTGRDMFRLYGL
ncbi:DUF1403 family protein [Sulfitobacter aestuarii]|uniref:DUF1403 family protein n=1 Tax=Sulfitobacter aestuarii TaxID=2161676 RepID=A0ABW5U724_9RHOB